MSFALRRRSADPARPWAALLFASLVVPVLLLAALLMPPGETQGETAHILRANALLHGGLLGQRMDVIDASGTATEEAGFAVNPALARAGTAFPGGEAKVLTEERLDQLLAVNWSSRLGWVSVPAEVAGVLPFLSIPAALGLGAAHVVGLGPLQAIIAARLCDALGFAAAGGLALVLARCGRGALLAALGLPITIALAGSANPDGLVVAVFCLAAALFTRDTIADWSWGTVVLAVGLAARPAYLPLALLPALAPGPLGAGRRLLGPLLAGLPAVAWAWVTGLAPVPALPRGSYEAGPLWPGPQGQIFDGAVPSEQLQVLLHQPALLLQLPLDLLKRGYDLLALELVGMLGSVNVLLPGWLYQLWFAALVGTGLALFFASPGERRGWPILASLAGLGCIAVSALVVADAFYLWATPVGAATIEGVDGRLAVPLIPTLGLVLPRIGLPGGEGVRALLQTPLVLACAAGLAVVPWLVVTTYYLH